MMKRQPDGTFRNARQASVLSPVVLRARWVEAEVVEPQANGARFRRHRGAGLTSWETSGATDNSAPAGSDISTGLTRSASRPATSLSAD